MDEHCDHEKHLDSLTCLAPRSNRKKILATKHLILIRYRFWQKHIAFHVLEGRAENVGSEHRKRRIFLPSLSSTEQWSFTLTACSNIWLLEFKECGEGEWNFIILPIFRVFEIFWFFKASWKLYKLFKRSTQLRGSVC